MNKQFSNINITAVLSAVSSTVNKGRIVASSLLFFSFIQASIADQVIVDDLVVTGSECIGGDCTNGEIFSFDTLRLKENNIRIKFDDTSNRGSFPSNDWQITINDSSNVGKNYFAIEDVSWGKTPFRVLAGAPTSSLHIGADGRVGFGTSEPLVNLHTRDGNSPTLRLEQDLSSGFSAQTWDVAGNETNFFIRDATNSKLPFKITPNAPNDSLFIGNNGAIGFGTKTPNGVFDIAHPDSGNNHALLVSTSANVGINIDNEQTPRGLLDIQTTGGVSKFLVQEDGKIAIGAGTATTTSNLFDVFNSGNSVFTIGTDGNITIANDLTISGALNATVPNPPGFSSLSATNVVTAQDMTVSNDLTVSGDLSVTGDLTLPGFSNISSSAITISANTLTTKAISATGTIHATGKISSDDDVCSSTGCINDFFSSRALKDVISDIDAQSILDKINDLYISRWSYKNQDNSITHIGPMSEDFHAAFGLNGNVTDRIAKVDASGVALAAIQALNNKLDKKDKEIATLKTEIANIKAMLKNK